MEDSAKTRGSFWQKAGKFLRAFILEKTEGVRLAIVERNARMAAAVMVSAAIAGLFFLFLGMLGFAAAFFLAIKMHSKVEGFLCVAGFYFLLAMGGIVFRKKLRLFFAARITRAKMHEDFKEAKNRNGGHNP